MANQFQLFKHRRFSAMFFTQFLGAFNDNVFKQALILVLTYTAASRIGVEVSILNNLAAMLFILPYFLFSALAGQIAIIGENMNIRRFQQVKEDAGFVASYTHMGGKIGVLVDVETDVVNDAVKEMAKNVAMQVAALKPLYTSDSEVSAEYIEHEKEILMAQIQNDPKESQKPEKVIQGMITGRIKKELKEICLLDQTYVKAEDGKQSVAKYVEQVAKENGAKIQIKGFVRYETGDGLEKKEENFAEEVAKQMGK